MSIFSRYKDTLIDIAEHGGKQDIEFPLPKTGSLMNGYNRGELIVVGGRKTSGKSSFLLNNYVIGPLRQTIEKTKLGVDVKTKIMYFNTRKSIKNTLDRMMVNYTSNINGGNKIGVPTLYGYKGNHTKITRAQAKKLISQTMNVFNSWSNNGTLSVIAGRKNAYEIEELIRTSMEEYGTLDPEEGAFTYKAGYERLVPIAVIDDITGVVGDNGGSSVRNENAHQLALKLKHIAKIYDMVIVLAVPSFNTMGRGIVHKSSVDEISPYGSYADRALILHNPLETEDKTSLDYETVRFVNQSSGVCYLRTCFVASNHMGPSGVYLGYFMYPENGYMMELPPADNHERLESYYDLLKPKKKKKEDE